METRRRPRDPFWAIAGGLVFVACVMFWLALTGVVPAKAEACEPTEIAVQDLEERDALIGHYTDIRQIDRAIIFLSKKGQKGDHLGSRPDSIIIEKIDGRYRIATPIGGFLCVSFPVSAIMMRDLVNTMLERPLERGA